MTFNYDEEDDFDEAEDFDEIENYNEAEEFDDVPEDDFLEEETEPNTALSRAFREATASEIEDDEDDEEDFDNEDDDESADEQLPIKPIEIPPEEDDEQGDDNEGDADESDDEEEDEQDEDEDEDEQLEIELPSLELPPSTPVVEPFRPRELSNTAYADAVKAYYEERNYQRAIEKFDEAIAYETQRTEGSPTNPNEIIAKAKYWQAEAYAKLQNLSQSIGIFEDLIETCQGHYLVLAAQRRLDQLNIGSA